MRRVGGVTALTLAGVLVAAGAAAALNSRVLLGGVSSPVGTAESFLPAEEPPAPALTTPPARVAPTAGTSPEPGEGPATAGPEDSERSTAAPDRPGAQASAGTSSPATAASRQVPASNAPSSGVPGAGDGHDGGEPRTSPTATRDPGTPVPSPTPTEPDD